MLYPSTIEQKIGFDKIRVLLNKECLSDLGRQHVSEMSFSTDYDSIEKLVSLTAELQYILVAQEAFPAQNFIDVTSKLSHAAIQGSILDEETFRDIRASLQTINQCLLFINRKESVKYPCLRELAEPVDIDVNLLKNINRIIDENGKVKDGASKALYDIRADLHAELSSVRKRLDTFLKQYQSEGMAADDMSITVRNGRLVIPLFAEYKRKVKGLIHDESATGQTVFIEPIEVFEANNRVRELEIEEKRELNRILFGLTDEIRLSLPELKQAYLFLGIIDFSRAKAKLAIMLGASKQIMQPNIKLNWHKVHHPLLYLSHKAMGKFIVPLSITLTETERILVISGPNAGGKSVVLKTVALLQYMHQSGLLVPNGEACTFGVFNEVFVDIGDEQSIENDLSTYSSHLTNMREIIKHSGASSLVLIDEFGTGTDPQYGGPIAEAILEELVNNKVLAVVNTHYSNLKYFAENTNGVVNGAMKFDMETIEPQYILDIGKPGNSFAIEIAEKIGLPKNTLSRAKSKIGEKKLNVDKLIKELQLEKNQFERKNSDIEKSKNNLQTAVDQYNELKLHIEQTKSELLKTAREDARKIIQEAKIEINILIKKLKESKKYDDLQAEEVRIKLREIESKQPVTKSTKNQMISDQDYKPKVGDRVNLKGQEGVFKIISLKENEAELAIGQLKTFVKINRLSLAEAADKKEIKVRTVVRGIDISQRMLNFSSTLDIRGKRGEEAMVELEYFLLKGCCIFLLQEYI